MSDRQQSTFGRRIDAIEETIIAVLLGLMTLLTFCNVIARYLFNSNILWALEVTVFLFAFTRFQGTETSEFTLDGNVFLMGK